MIQPFLINGYDGTTPLQAYCSVMTSDFMIVDTIYPHPHISICVRNIDGDDQFGDNAYTRNMAIKELIMLNNIVIAVKHYYYRYKAVLKTYTEIEAMEYDRYNKQLFKSCEDRGQYLKQMHQRLKQIYLHYLQRAIPEIPISENYDLVIQPYLLTQILNTSDIKFGR